MLLLDFCLIKTTFSNRRAYIMTHGVSGIDWKHCTHRHFTFSRSIKQPRMLLDKGEIFDDTSVDANDTLCNSLHVAARDCFILDLFSLDHNVDIRRLYLYIRL